MAERIDELQLGIGSDATKAINQLAKLSLSLGKAATSAKALSDNASGINSFVSSLKGFSDVNTKDIGKVTRSLRKLADVVPKISGKQVDLGLSLNGDTEAVNNITNVTQAYKTLAKVSKTSSGRVSVNANPFGQAFQAGLNGAVSGLKDVFKWSLNLGGKGASAIGSFMSKLGLIPSHTKNINNMGLSFSNLLRTILPFMGIGGIFNWLKESVGLGSSIVEIQNVIDTAFGNLKQGYEDISGYIYKWSKTTMDAFGVSELAAMQYAGRLQSIFNSSGFDATEGMRDSAAKMSTELIQRAGDIASFYDISVDEAMTKIQSGLVGMSRPLRSLGINMSVANMEAYALSQGINTSWKEMDQASQMALRYSYFMDASKYAAGDFQKTSQSLANQLRLLQLNFQMLSTTIGQGLVSAIAPVISWLNLLIRRLIQAANAFRTFMWTLFGKPLGAAKGIADDLFGSIEDSSDAASDLGGGAGDAASGLGSAGKAAKELKKQLTVLPFDELNQLAKDTDSASSGGSGGGGGGGAGGLGVLDTSSFLPDLNADLSGSDTADAINKWAKRIRKAFNQQDWDGVGKNIAYMLNAGFGYVYRLLEWDNWKDKVYGFIQPFQVTINSMFHYIDWGVVGATFARGLNNIVYTLRMWINGFNYRYWGKRIAFGLNSMLNEWDADAFGRLIADKFRAAWNFFGGWVENFDFTLLGSKLKEMVLGGLDELNPEDMGKSLGKLVNGIADTIIEFLGDGEVRKELADSFIEFVNGFIDEVDEYDVEDALQALGDTIFGAIKDAIGGIDKVALGEQLSTVLGGLPWGAIGLAIGAKAGGSLATYIFGTYFKAKAANLIANAFSGVPTGGTTGATGGATGASGATASGVGAITTATGLSAGAILEATGIFGALAALGIAMRKFADAHGGVEKGSNLNTDRSFGTKQTAPKAQNAAGYSTQIQKVPKSGSSGGETKNVVSTVYKGIVDGSMKTASNVVEGLKKDPTITKVLKGDTKQSLITGSDIFHALKSNSATKTIYGNTTGSYKTTRTAYGAVKNDKATKTVYGSKTAGFKTTYIDYFKVKNDKATKTAYGVPTRGFNSLLENYPKISSKDVTVTVDVKTTVKEIYASVVDKFGNWSSKLVGKIATIGNAKGGLFNGATAFQVFGEAGAEAAIPLERKSTMKRIASAIVDSGGMGTSNSDEIANAIAVRILPAIASMMVSQNERPINLNATLYTENNEVLARAVNQGNKSLDKRYHPVAQYSY